MVNEPPGDPDMALDAMALLFMEELIDSTIREIVKIIGTTINKLREALDSLYENLDMALKGNKDPQQKTYK